MKLKDLAIIISSSMVSILLWVLILVLIFAVGAIGFNLGCMVYENILLMI